MHGELTEIIDIILNCRKLRFEMQKPIAAIKVHVVDMDDPESHNRKRG
jgi:hypothetical protein